MLVDASPSSRARFALPGDHVGRQFAVGQLGVHLERDQLLGERRCPRLDGEILV